MKRHVGFYQAHQRLQVTGKPLPYPLVVVWEGGGVSSLVQGATH